MVLTENCCEKLDGSCCVVIKEAVVERIFQEKNPPELQPYGGECPLGEDGGSRRAVLLSCGEEER